MFVYPIKSLTKDDIPKQILQDQISHTTISPSSDKYDNGNALLQAYYANRDKYNYTIFLLPGEYDLSGRNLNLDSRELKIVGLGSPETILIQSEFSGKGSGVLHQTNLNAHLENLSIRNAFTGIQNYWSREVQDLENPINNNIIYNRVYARAGFSCEAALSFRTKNIDDPFSKIYKQIYAFDSNANNYSIAFKQNIADNICEYFIQDYATAEESGILGMENNYIPPSFSPAHKIRLGGGIWKLVSGRKEGERIIIDSVIALEKPKLNPSYSSTKYMSTPYEVKSWPWLVEQWINRNSSAVIPQKAYVVTKETFMKNVHFLRGNQSLAMNAPSYYGGKFIGCSATECAFGGNNGYLEGEFIDCRAKSYSFAPQFHRHNQLSMNNIKIKNCITEGYSLGLQGQIGSAEIKDLTIDATKVGTNGANIGKSTENTIIFNLVQRASGII